MSESGRQRIETRLTVVRQRIRRVQCVRALLLTACVLLGGLLVAMGLDLLFAPLPVAARWVVLVAWAVALVVALQRGLAPLLKPIGLVRIARWLEGRHPEMEERLSTALELSDDGRVSHELMEALVEAAEADVGGVDAVKEVDTAATVRRWRRPVVMLAMVLLAALLVRPSDTVRLIMRAVAPFSDVGTVGAGSFEILPGDVELMEGGAVEISASYDGNRNSVEVVMEFDDGREVAQPMERVGERWVYRLDPARESFRYRLRAGRIESDAYMVTVWPQPRLVDPRVRLEFPAYTGLAPQERGLGGRVEAVIGTTMRIQAEVNTPVEAAWLEMDSERRAEGTVETMASRGQVRIDRVLDASDRGAATVVLKHRLGEPLDGKSFDLEALDDQAPQVTLLSPTQNELQVRPDEVVELSYEVVEDFGLARVVVEAEAGRKGGTELGQVLPERYGAPERMSFRGDAPVSVGELRDKFDGAREIHLRVVAEDARPEVLGGPGRGASEWLILKVREDADSLARQRLRSEHEDAMKTLEKAIERTREARGRMDWKSNELLSEEPTPEAQTARQEVAERLAEAESELEKLADRMDEGIHARKADEVRKASEQVSEAEEEFEEVALQDDREVREEKLQAARDKADEALEMMHKTLEKIRGDERKVEDLARVEELAQEQRELAREAAAQAMSDEPAEDWERRQEQMEAALRQELTQRPEATAEALAREAERARELADEARTQADAQQGLEELAREASGDAEDASMESVKEQLKQAQQALAEESRSAAQEEGNKPMSQAAEHAEKAAEQGQADDFAEMAEEGRQAAEAMREAGEEAEAEAESERAQAMAQRQEHLAEAAQAVAEGDAQRAAEAMEAAEDGSPELAEAIREALEQEQAEIAQAARGELAEAREARSELADHLPQAAAASQEAREALAEGPMNEASQQAAEAAEALGEAAGKASEMAQASGEPQAAGQAEQLDELAQRQQQVAEAAEALAKGEVREALEQLQAMQAADAAALASEVASAPELTGNPLGKAKDESRAASEQARKAAAQAAEGQQAQAADAHAESSQDWQQAAEALDQASQQLADAAARAASMPSRQNQAPIDAASFAKAFEQASQAGEAPSGAQAAQHAAEAAQALSQAAAEGRAQMQGRRQQGQPGQPMPPGQQPGLPGDSPQDDLRMPEPDPGVPPELAKLGISAGDWEKIQASLRSDVGSAGAAGLPEDYRELVKDYFESMAK